MKKILATILAAALGLGAWALTGTGTSTDPFKIATLADLQEFRDSVNASAQNIYKGKYVRLDADLDLNNEPWTPIGNSSATPFSCIFDGNGKTISNLYINDSTMNFAGFIGYTSDATIMGLKIHNANLTGNDYVGAIAGSAHATTTVQDCEVSGSIKLSGNHYVGGITGSGYAKVTGCKTLGDGAATSYIRAADAEVNAGDGDDVGGIIGLDEGGKSAIENCHVSDITVEGFRQVGGIAGLIQNGRPVVSCTVKDVVVKCIADQNTVDNKAAKMAFGGIVGAINQSGGSVTGCTVEDVQLVSDPVGVSAARMGYVSGGYYPGTEGFLIPDSLSDKITCADNTVKNVVRATEGLQEPAGASRAIDGPLFVAQVGDVKYETLAAAVAAVPADSTATTITMIEDSAETVGSTVAAGQKIVLDLNGKSVSYESAFPAAFNLIAVNGTLTVTDTSDGSNGSIALTSTANLSWDYAVNMFLVGNGGSLTIEKGSYSVTTPSYGYAEYVIAASNNSGASTVVINGGTFIGNNIDAVVRLHDQYGRNQPLNVTVNGGDFTLNGSQCDSVIWFDVQKSGNGTDNASVANLVINGGTFTSTSASPALDIGHSVDASGLRVTVAGGAFKSNGNVIKTRELSAAAIANIKLSGGIYSGDEYYNDLTKTTDKLDALCVAGCKVAANADAETSGNYPYVVGLLKVSDIVQQAGATETSATYAVTVVVVNDKGETIGTLPDQLTIEVSIAAADAAGSTLAKYDVSKVLDAALASGGLNVTKVEISVVISAPSSGEGTVSYEVHPEAVVTVTKDATNTTTTIPLSNACLAADASFTFDLDVTGVVAAGDWAKVTHVSADPKYAAEVRNLKAVAGDGGKVYVTVTTTHFSTFTIGTGVPPVKFDVRSDNLFGSIKIAENVASNLYVAVPFEGFEADGALRKAQDVVHATNLTAGTKMYVYDKTADKYDVYEVDANGKWAAALKINVTEMENTFDTADLTRGVTNGTGVIVGRKNTAETVYVYGQVPKIPIASTTFGAGQTLVSPPYTNGVEYVDLNASTWTGVSATTKKRLKGQADADYIQFRAPNNKLVKYYYLEGEGWGVVPTQVSQFSEFVANGKALIPVGTAFWYYSKAKAGGAKVEWK